MHMALCQKFLFKSGQSSEMTILHSNHYTRKHVMNVAQTR